MRFVNISGLKRLGGGVFSTVYRLSPNRVIKVYDNYVDHSINIMAEEIELSMKSPHALPVLDIAIAKRRTKRYYAVIKKYLPYRVTWEEIDNLRDALPGCLREDCHIDNARKDEKGNVFLIDTQGRYAFELL